MRLGEHLDVTELLKLIEDGHIKIQRHPTHPLAILNYSNECMFNDYWPDVIQKCRGLIINAPVNHEPCDDCEVVSRPFHKFFNLNHESQPAYYEGNLPEGVPTVTEKVDGWFGILWHYRDDNREHHYGIASRGSFTSPGATFGTAKLQKLVKYGAIEAFPEGYTPIFEIIFKDGKIVIDYPFEGLVLLGCVNIETGEELPYDKLQAVWANIAGYSADGRPWIRLVKAHKMTLKECLNFENLVLETSIPRNTDGSVKNFEGFVLSYPRSGTYPIKVKVKLDEYKRLHKLITGVTPQQIWKTLHDPMAEWLGGDVPDHFRTWAINWRDSLYSKFHEELEAVQSLLRERSIIALTETVLDDKAWQKALFAELTRLAPEQAGIAMSLLDNKIYQVYQSIWANIKPVGRETETFYREGNGE